MQCILGFSSCQTNHKLISIAVLDLLHLSDGKKIFYGKKFFVLFYGIFLTDKHYLACYHCKTWTQPDSVYVIVSVSMSFYRQGGSVPSRWDQHT